MPLPPYTQGVCVCGGGAAGLHYMELRRTTVRMKMLSVNFIQVGEVIRSSSANQSAAGNQNHITNIGHFSLTVLKMNPRAFSFKIRILI